MFARLLGSFVALALLAACAEPDFAPLATTPATNPQGTVFVATNRADDDAGWFTGDRAGQSAYLAVPVVFPTSYAPGDAAPIRATPDPARDFSVTGQRRFDRAGFRAALRADLAKEPRGSRDVTLYVHGYYNAFFTGVFQSARLSRDFDLPGAMVHFSWPSRGSNTAYAYDRDSLLASRDAMEATIRDMASIGAERVTLVAHSLGAMLIMEALRQIEFTEPGWTGRNIDAIAFVAPDIDIDVFRSQASRLARLPEDFVIFVSDRDQVLRFSSRLAGEPTRLGNSQGVAVDARGEVAVVDVSALTPSARSGHFIPATSPVAIRLFKDSDAFRALFPRSGLGRETEPGVRLIEIGAR